jgi:hypothetical protein
MNSPVESVESLHAPKRVQVSGFDLTDSSAHMIAWLGRGGNLHSLIVNDVEREVYEQTPDAQVLRVDCAGEPNLETVARTKGLWSSKATVRKLTAVFPLSLTVQNADGALWQLAVQLRYESTDLDKPGPRQVRQDFVVIDAQRKA